MCARASGMRAGCRRATRRATLPAPRRSHGSRPSVTRRAGDDDARGPNRVTFVCVSGTNGRDHVAGRAFRFGRTDRFVARGVEGCADVVESLEAETLEHRARFVIHGTQAFTHRTGTHRTGTHRTGTHRAGVV